jgi:hypothetical protein
MARRLPNSNRPVRPSSTPAKRKGVPLSALAQQMQRSGPRGSQDPRRGPQYRAGVGRRWEVSVEEIEKNDFNRNIPRYIDSQQTEDVQDIAGHLKGGIPSADVDALQRYWDVCLRSQEATARHGQASANIRAASTNC